MADHRDPDSTITTSLGVGVGPTLEDLLEHAARTQAASFGPGSLVGEVLDTHHPHLPRRVFVRVRDAEGVPITAWLPTLAELRIRVGARVLVSKPDNWPEPVVLGVLTGLESDPSPTLPESRDEPELRLEPGEALVIKGPDGRAILRIAATAAGPELTLVGGDAAIEVPGTLRIGAGAIELRANEGDVDIRAQGDTLVRSRFIRLN